MKPEEAISVLEELRSLVTKEGRYEALTMAINALRLINKASGKLKPLHVKEGERIDYLV